MESKKSGESNTLAESPQPSDVASALHRLADVAEKFYAKLYPEHVPQTAVIHRPSDEKRKQYEDKMPEGWEDEQSPAAEPGRFEGSFNASKTKKRTR